MSVKDQSKQPIYKLIVQSNILTEHLPLLTLALNTSQLQGSPLLKKKNNKWLTPALQTSLIQNSFEIWLALLRLTLWYEPVAFQIQFAFSFQNL